MCLCGSVCLSQDSWELLQTQNAAEPSALSQPDDDSTDVGGGRHCFPRLTCWLVTWWSQHLKLGLISDVFEVLLLLFRIFTGSRECMFVWEWVLLSLLHSCSPSVPAPSYIQSASIETVYVMYVIVSAWPSALVFASFRPNDVDSSVQDNKNLSM